MSHDSSETAFSLLQDVPLVDQVSAHQCLEDTPCGFDSKVLTVRACLLVVSKIEGINPTVQRLMWLLRRTCCPAEHEFAVETALREALANAIVHGNHSNPRKKVRICCGCDAARGIHILVRDEGAGFDPATLPNPVASENLASEHGRGIFLIYRLMDEVRFESGGREIHMRKGGKASQ